MRKQKEKKDTRVELYIYFFFEKKKKKRKKENNVYMNIIFFHEHKKTPLNPNKAKLCISLYL